MSTPYIYFSNEVLENVPLIKAGDKAPYPKCGELTIVKDSNPPTLQFISHCGGDYIVGIESKFVGNKMPTYSGKVEL